MKAFVDWIVKQKDLLTTIAGGVQLLIVTVTQYMDSLNGGEFSWVALLSSLAVAFVAYLTGKGKTGA
jgi:hypothetical protein